MAENKNQSATQTSYRGWPRISGGATTGSLDMSKFKNPKDDWMARKMAINQASYMLATQSLTRASDLNNQMVALAQGLATGNINREAALLEKRQANLQRMTQLYGNHFHEFGGVLNKEALEFLDKNAKINVPTLTAIMAGYEHARASAADRDMLALQQQQKLFESAQAIEKDRVALENQRAANNALTQQNQIQQQLDTLAAQTKAGQAYIEAVDKANDIYYGVGGGTGRSGGAGGGIGGGFGGGARSFDGDSVTGGGGDTGIAQGGNPSYAAYDLMQQEMAERNTNKEVSLGPLSQEVRDVQNSITTLNDAVGVTGALFAGSWATSKLFNSIGTSARMGYLDPKNLEKYNKNLRIKDGLSSRLELAKEAIDAQQASLSRRAGTYGARSTTFKLKDDIEQFVKTYKTNKIFKRTVNRDPVLKNLVDTYEQTNKRASSLTNRISKVEGTMSEALKAMGGQAAYDKATKASMLRKFTGGAFRQFAKPFTLLSKVSPWAFGAEIITRGVDEGAGVTVATTGWLADRFRDITGQTTIEEARARGSWGDEWMKAYTQASDEARVAKNRVANYFTGLAGRQTSVGLEHDDVKQVVDRLHELGWESDAGALTMLMQMYERDKDSFRGAIESLYDGSYNPQSGQRPIDFFVGSVYKSARNKEDFRQQNRAAEVQQQKLVDEMNAQRVGQEHPMLQALANQAVILGQQAGYEYDLPTALAGLKAIDSLITTWESGGRRGAVGESTSTGTAKSRKQIMDGTFLAIKDRMLKDDNESGGALFRSDAERNALRNAQTASDLEGTEFDHLLDLFIPYSVITENVDMGKFGFKGNAGLKSRAVTLDLLQTFADGGGQINPLFAGDAYALYGSAWWHGKPDSPEIAKIQNNVNNNYFGPMFGDRADGKYYGAAYRRKQMTQHGRQIPGGTNYAGVHYESEADRNAWVQQYFTTQKDSKGNVIKDKDGNPKIVPKPDAPSFTEYENRLNMQRGDSAHIPKVERSSNLLLADANVDFDGSHSLLRERANRWADYLTSEFGIRPVLTSMQRSKSHQQRLKNDPNAKMPANPGSSNHNAGMAFDVSMKQLRVDFNNSKKAQEIYGTGDQGFRNFVKQTALLAGLYQFDPINDDVDFRMIEDEEYKKRVNHDLFKEHKKKGLLDGSAPYERVPGLRLPSGTASKYPMLNLMPTEEVPQEQPAYTPQAWDYPLTQMGFPPSGVQIMPQQTPQQQVSRGGFSPTNYEVAIEQMTQYNQANPQESRQQIGWDENGNPVYQ